MISIKYIRLIFFFFFLQVVPFMISKIVSLASSDSSIPALLENSFDEKFPDTMPTDDRDSISASDFTAEMESSSEEKSNLYQKKSLKKEIEDQAVYNDAAGNSNEFPISFVNSGEGSFNFPAPTADALHPSSLLNPSFKSIINSASNLLPNSIMTKAASTFRCTDCNYSTLDPNLYSIHSQFCKSRRGGPSAAMLSSQAATSDSKPFKCHKCSYSARTQSALNYHLKTHSGIKPFVCNLCSYSTIIRRSLVVHMRTHTQEKPYACTFCSYRANQKSNLDSHMTSRHLKNRIKSDY